MVSSSDLKYKLMWLLTYYFSGLLQNFFHVFLYEKNIIIIIFIQCGTLFFQGTSVSINFYVFEHYQLWMMDSKAQMVFFVKTPTLCV